MDFVIVVSPSGMVLLVVVDQFAMDLLSVETNYLTRVGILMEGFAAIVQSLDLMMMMLEVNVAGCTALISAVCLLW